MSKWTKERIACDRRNIKMDKNEGRLNPYWALKTLSLFDAIEAERARAEQAEAERDPCPLCPLLSYCEEDCYEEPPCYSAEHFTSKVREIYSPELVEALARVKQLEAERERADKAEAEVKRLGDMISIKAWPVERTDRLIRRFRIGRCMSNDEYGSFVGSLAQQADRAQKAEAERDRLREALEKYRGAMVAANIDFGAIEKRTGIAAILEGETHD